MRINEKIRGALRVILATFLYSIGLVNIRKMVLSWRRPLVRFILIHHVKNPDKFENIISYLATKYNPISFDDFVHKRFDRNRINVVLTMDDGYASWSQTAISILEKYRVPVLMFVSSGFVKSSESAEERVSFCKERLKLSWSAQALNSDSLLALSKNSLVTIGGHTATHPHLTKISPQLASREICDDKTQLENWILKPVLVFAYPFGNYDERVIKIVHETGYRYAVTTRSAFVRADNDPYIIPRSNHGTVSKFEFKLWVLGAFDCVDMIEDKLKAIFRIFYW